MIVVEEVGVDRSVDARIVELDQESSRPSLERFGQAGPDFGGTDVDPVARRVVVGPVSLGDDPDALGLEVQGDNRAVEFLAGLLESADQPYHFSFFPVPSPRPLRP